MKAIRSRQTGLDLANPIWRGLTLALDFTQEDHNQLPLIMHQAPMGSGSADLEWLDETAADPVRPIADTRPSDLAESATVAANRIVPGKLNYRRGRVMPGTLRMRLNNPKSFIQLNEGSVAIWAFVDKNDDVVNQRICHGPGGGIRFNMFCASNRLVSFGVGNTLITSTKRPDIGWNLFSMCWGNVPALPGPISHNLTGYVNGQIFASTGAHWAGDPLPASINLFGQEVSGTQELTGYAGHAYFWRRHLEDGEHQNLYRFPWRGYK